jgi:hypothetical protein
VKLVVSEDEDPSKVVDRFVRHIEFLMGLKVDKSRLIFSKSISIRPFFEDREVVSRALESLVGVATTPRSWHTKDNPGREYDDIIPMIMKEIGEDNCLFPLNCRFRIWTVIWGTARVIKKLIEVNPDFMEKARSLGVTQEVFDDVFNVPIPSSPASTLIPLEVLESVVLLRALFGYMHETGLIENYAGLCLEMDLSQ